MESASSGWNSTLDILASIASAPCNFISDIRLCMCLCVSAAKRTASLRLYFTGSKNSCVHVFWELIWRAGKWVCRATVFFFELCSMLLNWLCVCWIAFGEPWTQSWLTCYLVMYPKIEIGLNSVENMLFSEANFSCIGVCFFTCEHFNINSRIYEPNHLNKQNPIYLHQTKRIFDEQTKLVLHWYMNALNALERKKKTIGACKLSILPKDSQSARKTYVYILSLLAKNESGGFAMQESSNVLPMELSLRFLCLNSQASLFVMYNGYDWIRRIKANSRRSSRHRRTLHLFRFVFLHFALYLGFVYVTLREGS